MSEPKKHILKVAFAEIAFGRADTVLPNTFWLVKNTTGEASIPCICLIEDEVVTLEQEIDPKYSK